MIDTQSQSEVQNTFCVRAPLPSCLELCDPSHEPPKPALLPSSVFHLLPEEQLAEIAFLLGQISLLRQLLESGEKH